MRTCPVCKSKLSILDIFKSMFRKNMSLNCSHCHTKLALNTNYLPLINGIMVGVVVFIFSYIGQAINNTYNPYIAAVSGGLLAMTTILIVWLCLSIIIGYKEVEQ